MKDDSDERRNKWITHWNKLDDFPPVTIKQIMYVLEKYYPNIMKKKELLDFVKLCDISHVEFNEVENLNFHKSRRIFNKLLSAYFG